MQSISTNQISDLEYDLSTITTAMELPPGSQLQTSGPFHGNVKEALRKLGQLSDALDRGAIAIVDTNAEAIGVWPSNPGR